MREHACLFLLHSFSSIPLDLERSSRRLPNVRDGRSALLTDARPQRRGIIFDQDAETPLCAGGVSQESRWRIRGEPPPRAASRPSALAGTPEHPASAACTELWERRGKLLCTPPRPAGWTSAHFSRPKMARAFTIAAIRGRCAGGNASTLSPPSAPRGASP